MEVPAGRCRIAGFVLSTEVSSQSESASELRAKDGAVKRNGSEMYLRVYVSSHRWVMTLGPAGLDVSGDGVTQVWTKLEARNEEEQEAGEEEAVFEGMSENCQVREIDQVRFIEGLVVYANSRGAPMRIEVSLAWRIAGTSEDEEGHGI